MQGFASRLAAVLVFVALAAPALAEKRVALVLGEGAYEHADRLANPVTDARNMRAMLKQIGFADADIVYGEDLNKRELERAIGRFAALARDADVAIAYYAGHGATFGDTPYLVPIDARFESVDQIRYELTPLEDMVGELRKAKGVRIAILDACRDNSAERDLKRSDARGGEVSRGLAPPRNPEGLIVAYATQYLSTAADGASGGDSPFTAALLRRLPTPGLDVKDLFFEVGNDVLQSTGGRQRPEVKVSFFEHYTLVPGRPAPAAESQQAEFDAAMAGGAPSLRGFIEKYKSGPLVNIARRELQRLAQQALLEAKPVDLPWRLPQGAKVSARNGCNSIFAMAVSPDGRFALQGGLGQNLSLWDLAKGVELRRFGKRQSSISAVAFSPDGGLALLAESSGAIVLLDPFSGTEIRRFAAPKSWVNAVAFSPNGSLALSGGSDRAMRLFDVATGKEIRTFQGHTGQVKSVAFTPDGRYALSAGWGGASDPMRLWDVASGVEIRRFPVGDFVGSIAVSPDGRTALSGGADHTMRLWDIATGLEIRRFPGHPNTVAAVAFSRDGRTALSGGADSVVRLFDVASAKEIQAFTGHEGQVSKIAFAAGAPVSTGFDGTMKLWDAETGNMRASFVSVEPCYNLDARGWVSYSPDGLFVAEGGDVPKMLRIVDRDGKDLPMTELIAKNRRDSLADVLAAGK